MQPVRRCSTQPVRGVVQQAGGREQPGHSQAPRRVPAADKVQTVGRAEGTRLRACHTADQSIHGCHWSVACPVACPGACPGARCCMPWRMPWRTLLHAPGQ